MARVRPAVALQPRRLGGFDEYAEVESSDGAAVRAADLEASELKDRVLSCNKTGMEYLQAGEAAEAFQHFKSAEALLSQRLETPNYLPLLAVTCNNLGCYYKSTGKFHGALSYFRRALKMEIELGVDQVTVAGTHLNLCAMLSNLDKHDKAMQHGLCALELMSKQLNEADGVIHSDDASLLAIAYHKVATEREHLKQWDQAATCYRTGFLAASRLLGSDHPLALALSEHTDAVLRKAKANSTPARTTKQQLETAMAQDLLVGLPDVPGKPLEKEPTQPMGTVSVRAEAAEWIKTEESLWSIFAKKTLSGAPAPPLESEATGGVSVGGSRPTSAGGSGSATPSVGGAVDPFVARPRAALALNQLKKVNFETPLAYDMARFRFCERPKEKLLKTTSFLKALDAHPDALMDLIEAESDGRTCVRRSANDFRPNRVVGRSSRTARLVRRTGVFNSTHYRDQCSLVLQKRRTADMNQFASLAEQNIAAKRIQTVWRSWYQYCQQNSEWLTVTWICATMIQAHWRSFRVRRQRLSKHAIVIQRHIRGILVRSVMKKYKAAVKIQKRALGMITRERLRRLHVAARNIQRLVRGGLTRLAFQVFREQRLADIVRIQKAVRAYLAKLKVLRRREELRIYRLVQKAIIDIQRVYRGFLGRRRVKCDIERNGLALQKSAAAVTIQSHQRRLVDSSRVKSMRQRRFVEMDDAATNLQRIWVGARTRRAYQQLREDYLRSVSTIVTIQRYMRGCMTRGRMWREVVRAEEEKWAAAFIQRVWKGYLGRVRFENVYEDMWRQELGAALIQRNARGWLARLRVSRVKKGIARKEFEHARLRFLAAQRIQAMVRGALCRRGYAKRRRRVTRTVVEIQRRVRGRQLRLRLWAQILLQKAIVIQACVRRFLVRCRLHRISKVAIVLQRFYRVWRMRPHSGRQKVALDKRRRRKASAILIQRSIRDCLLRKKLRELRALRGARGETLEDS